MKVKQFDTKVLDEILEKMMDTVGNSRMKFLKLVNDVVQIPIFNR